MFDSQLEDKDLTETHRNVSTLPLRHWKRVENDFDLTFWLFGLFLILNLIFFSPEKNLRSKDHYLILEISFISK